MKTLVLLLCLSFVSTSFATITLTASQMFVPVGSDVQMTCKTDVKGISIQIFNGTELMSSCSIFTCQRSNLESSSTTPSRVNSNAGYDIISLELRNFQIKDSATYKCMNSNNTTVQDIVTVTHAVSITSVVLKPSYERVNVVDGVPFNFSCITSDSRPAATVSWFKGSENITAFSTNVITNYITNSTLIYTSSKADQGERIRCEGNNGGTTVSSLVSPQANVQFGPSVPECDFAGTKVQSTIRVPEGWNFSLDCTSRGNPPPILTWNHPGSGLSTPLTLLNIQKIHTGTFTVTGSNTLTPSGKTFIEKSTSTSYVVEVMYKAAITEFKVANSDGEDVILDEGISIPFDCKVDSDPGAQIVLQKAGQHIKEVNNSKSIHYVKKDSQCEDEGTYSCTANNFLNNVSDKRTMNVYVKCSPRVSTKSPTIINVTAGTSSSATLTFNFIAYPRPSASNITWEKHDLENNDWTVLYNTSNITITLYKDSLQTNISIIDVKPSDYGRYRVTVSNVLGSITENFLLKSEEVPGPPNNLRFSDRVTDSSVTITWLPGFDGGLPQTFIVQFRDTSTVKWKEEEVDTGHIKHTIHNLKPGTTYEVKLIARNSLGNSSSSDTITVTTLKSLETPAPGRAAIIGGSVGGVAGIGLLGIVLFVVLKLRQKDQTKESACNLTKDQKMCPVSKSRSIQDDEDDEVINPIYAGGGDDRNNPADAVYSGHRNHDQSASGDVYAMVIKQNKHMNENSDKRNKTKGGNINSGYDLYANNDVSTGNDKPPNSVVQDGLVYADLEFPNPPKGQKPVIHGLDDMTEYAEVDQRKRADPVP